MSLIPCPEGLNIYPSVHTQGYFCGNARPGVSGMPAVSRKPDDNRGNFDSVGIWFTQRKGQIIRIGCGVPPVPAFGDGESADA